MSTKDSSKKESLPKVIIMMVSSFDGQAKGKYLFDQGSPRTGLVDFFKEFSAIPHQGDIYGSKTMKEAYCPGEIDLSKYNILFFKYYLFLFLFKINLFIILFTFLFIFQ